MWDSSYHAHYPSARDVTSRPDAHGQLHEQTGVYLLGALPTSERARFEAHLAVCAECAAEARALRFSLEAIGRSVSQIETPPARRRAGADWRDVLGRLARFTSGVITGSHVGRVL